jgi:predicted metal-binding membrane protein
MITAARLQIDRPGRRVVVGLVVSAWAILAVWSASPYAALLSHTGIGERGVSPILRLVAFGAGWALMTVAMMLPGSLPLLERFSQAAQHRPERNWLMAQLIGGYLIVWMAFGWTAYLGDMVLHAAVERVPWLHQASGGIMAAVLLTAGVYQFTPLKRHYLNQCRPSYGFRRAPHDAFRIGFAHGRACLGSCWALMLLMFALGGMSLGGMLLLGVIMTAERTTRRGQELARPVGVVLILWAALSLAGQLLVSNW